MTDTETQIQAGVVYIHKKDHRHNSPRKSQWIITEEEERNSFHWAFLAALQMVGLPVSIVGVKQEALPTQCWGLHFVEGTANYLGTKATDDPGENELFIAKYIDSNSNSRWHGYPVNHSGKSEKDKPSTQTLAVWLEYKMLRPAVVKKIAKGQKCSL